MDTSKQHVFITGGSSGIGYAIASIYAARGAHVTAVGRHEDRLLQACGETLCPSVLDVTDIEAVRRAAEDYIAEHGAPDIVINCAGTMIPGEFLKMDKATFDTNIKVDFDGTVTICRAFGPAMAERGSGQIVNIASVAGFLGIFGYTSYSAAKFAVMGFSEALRFELEPLGVGVTVICPPDTETPGLAAEIKLRPHETDVVAGTIKPVSAESVARAAVKGIDKKKRTVIIGAQSKLYYRLKGLLPEVFYWIVSRDVRKAQKEHSV